MKCEWIVVANAARALIFERREGDEEMTLYADLGDPTARTKGVDLVSDRSGYELPPTQGLKGSAYAPHLNAREKEHEDFARLVAGHLNDGIAAHHCDSLAIVASMPFLGHLKGHLSAQSSKALKAGVAKDLMAYSGDELRRRVDRALMAAA